MTEWSRQLGSISETASSERPRGGQINPLEPLWDQPKAAQGGGSRPPAALVSSVEAQVAEAARVAYASGAADGAAHKERECAQQIAAMHAACELAIVDREREFLESHGARMAARIEQGLAQIGREVESAVLEALAPFVATRLQDAMNDDVITTLQHAATISEATAVKLTGRQAVVETAAARLRGMGLEVELAANVDDDLAISLNGAVIRSRFKQWVGELENVLR